MSELNVLWEFHWLFIVAMFVALALGHVGAGIFMYVFLLINGCFLMKEIKKM